MKNRSSFSLEANLIRIQWISALLFFPFLVVHLFNALLGVLGASVYNAFQGVLQAVYQQPVIELLFVLLPLLLHLTAGLGLLFMWRCRPPRKTVPRLHSWAGIVLALFVVGHVIATRGLPWLEGIHAGYGGVAFSLWWMPWYFYPYYTLLFMAGSYHALTGLALLRRRRLPPTQRPTGPVVGWPLLGALFLCTIIALLGFGGLFGQTSDPRDNDFARMYSELFNIELYPQSP